MQAVQPTPIDAGPHGAPADSQLTQLRGRGNPVLPGRQSGYLFIQLGTLCIHMVHKGPRALILPRDWRSWTDGQVTPARSNYRRRDKAADMRRVGGVIRRRGPLPQYSQPLPSPSLSSP